MCHDARGSIGVGTSQISVQRAIILTPFEEGLYTQRLRTKAFLNL